MDNSTKDLITAIGALAEMAHQFYSAMLGVGASPAEANVGMTGFIQAFWRDAMDDARRKQREAQDDA